MIPHPHPDYSAVAWRQPSRISAHPFILMNPEHGSPDANGGAGAAGRPASDVELYIQTNKSVDGLFVRQSDVDHLGLKALDEVETCYGLVTRISPVYLTAVSHSILISNVYLLPQAFEGTPYGEGIVGLSLIWSLGVTVAIDRGMVYLVHPEALEDEPIGLHHQPASSVRDVEVKDGRILAVGEVAAVAVAVPGSVVEMSVLPAAAEGFAGAGVVHAGGCGAEEDEGEEDGDRNVMETVVLA